MKKVLTLMFAVAAPAVAFAVPMDNVAAPNSADKSSSQAPAMGTAVYNSQGTLTSTTSGETTEKTAGKIGVAPVSGDLAKYVQDNLAARSEFSQSLNNLRITANGGRVTLEGAVNSQAERRDINNAVEKMPGVTSVDNKLGLKQ